jgi:hypothetical protein
VVHNNSDIADAPASTNSQQQSAAAASASGIQQPALQQQKSLHAVNAQVNFRDLLISRLQQQKHLQCNAKLPPDTGLEGAANSCSMQLSSHTDQPASSSSRTVELPRATAAAAAAESHERKQGTGSPRADLRSLLAKRLDHSCLQPPQQQQQGDKDVQQQQQQSEWLQELGKALQQQLKQHEGGKALQRDKLVQQLQQQQQQPEMEVDDDTIYISSNSSSGSTTPIRWLPGARLPVEAAELHGRGGLLDAAAAGEDSDDLSDMLQLLGA